MKLRGVVHLLAVAWLGGIAATASAAEPATIDFAHEIVPLLKSHCTQCHGGEHAEGGFSLNTRESILEAGAVDLGEPAASRILELITGADDARMPPSKLPRLSTEEVKRLRIWINAGLPWEPGFSFSVERYQSPLFPRRPELPEGDAARNPVDRIVDAYFALHDVTPGKPLSDGAFYRRLSLDLVGLLPTVEELAAFEADQAADKRAQLVDELLARNRDYAEHWFTFWNDLLRNDYVGTGYIDGGRTHISGWLYGSLLENKPYDQCVRELVAPNEQSAGFVGGIKWRGNVNASQHPNIQFAQNVSQVFLGINMKCASCHDSFVDHWTLDETYGLASIYADEPLETYRCDVPTGHVVEARWIYPELGQVDPAAPQPARLRQLAALMTHPQNGRLTRTMVNRLWHRLMGRGIVHPVDAMDTVPWSEDLLDYLAVHLADNNYDLKSTLRLIATSEAYQTCAIACDQEPPPSDYVFRGPMAKRMTAEQFMDAMWGLTRTEPTEAHKRVNRFLTEGGWEPPERVRAALVASDFLQRSLGRPNREQVVSSRPTEITMLQALDLSNGEIVADVLQRGAFNLQADWQAKAPEEFVAWLYQAALVRSPSDAESAVGLELLCSPPTTEGYEDFLWAVLMLPEFQLVR